MDTTHSQVSLPAFLKLAAHDIRWQLLSVLARSDYRVQELVHLVGQPANLVSYHLRQLRDHHVVTERRSTADERALYYSLDLETVRSLYQATGEALHPALRLFPEVSSLSDVSSLASRQRVLFLCTENSARSQMAEALLRHLSREGLEVFSAGSTPTQVHPFALQVLEASGIDTTGLHAKHFDTFVGQPFDRVITVCDRVRETCPTFPGDPERIHWSFADPAQDAGTVERQYRAFEQTSLQLTTRLRFLLIHLEREMTTNRMHK